jgi:hypothetical protein
MEKENKDVETKPAENNTEKIRRNPWIIATVFLAVLVVVLLFLNFQGGFTGKVISKDNAGEKLLNFYTQTGVEGLTVKDVKETNGVYLVTFSYQGQEVPIYVTKDGKLAGSLSAIQTEEDAEDIPKSEKPKVELFVMSFCPYGMEAEKAFKPVYDLLKDKIDFKIRFITSPSGDTIDKVSSLHGNLEAQEDARQICIEKYYPDKLWDYLYEMANSCSTSYQSEGELSACWMSSASKTGITISKIQSCYVNEQKMIIDRLKEDKSLAGNYGVTGSESFVLNGVKVGASQYRWSPDKIKELICSASKNPSELCSQSLGDGSASSSTASCN